MSERDALRQCATKALGGLYLVRGELARLGERGGLNDTVVYEAICVLEEFARVLPPEDQEPE